MSAEKWVIGPAAYNDIRGLIGTAAGRCVTFRSSRPKSNIIHLYPEKVTGDPIEGIQGEFITGYVVDADGEYVTLEVM